MLSASLCLAPRQALSLPEALIGQQIRGSKVATACQEHRAGEGQGLAFPSTPAGHLPGEELTSVLSLRAGQQVDLFVPRGSGCGREEEAPFLAARPVLSFWGWSEALSGLNMQG